MAFDLAQLGWKGFQDLCAAVAAEVLDRPVQTFLPGNDGGRDAAFLGTWRSAPAGPVKSTIQCKFTLIPNARLSLAKLKTELAKVAELSQAGLAEDYVVMTNAGVTGTADAAICKAFMEAGAKHCQVFDGDWILRQVRERPRLRMMAPRVYGLLGLSELITGPAYDQARSILAEMGGDLGAFVPTKAHQAAVAALAEHGFVLLVGDPASGKSTIAATLALGALDDGCSGAVRISSPDQLELWRPDERQFLWVDDAFGPTQYEPARVQRWNAELPRLRAAVRDGARVVFTTRNYIWERARQQLKLGAFALLEESQVVVDVQALTQPERARILYNHVRTGGHPMEVRRKLKPHLARLSHNPNLTPEIARRLGDPYITTGLPIRRESLDRFVDHPVAFLREVVEKLSDAGRAALALVFMHPSSGLPSPIPQGEALDTVTRLSGCEPSEIARELEAMDGSLTLLVPGEQSDRWVFRHPTIADAFADLVAASPEQVELYVAGARLERLMVEVVYVAAAAMIEARTGETWQALMAKEVFAPLKLKSAGFGPPGRLGALDQPVGHGAALQPHRPGEPHDDLPLVIGPAGRVHMSLADLITYLAAHRDRTRLLAPATWDTLHTPHFEDREYALGWNTWPDGSLTHDGGNLLWYAVAGFNPKSGWASAAATNDGPPTVWGDVGQAAREARAAVSVSA